MNYLRSVLSGSKINLAAIVLIAILPIVSGCPDKKPKGEKHSIVELSDELDILARIYPGARSVGDSVYQNPAGNRVMLARAPHAETDSILQQSADFDNDGKPEIALIACELLDNAGVYRRQKYSFVLIDAGSFKQGAQLKELKQAEMIEGAMRPLDLELISLGGGKNAAAFYYEKQHGGGLGLAKVLSLLAFTSGGWESAFNLPVHSTEEGVAYTATPTFIEKNGEPPVEIDVTRTIHLKPELGGVASIDLKSQKREVYSYRVDRYMISPQLSSPDFSAIEKREDRDIPLLDISDLAGDRREKFSAPAAAADRYYPGLSRLDDRSLLIDGRETWRGAADYSIAFAASFDRSSLLLDIRIVDDDIQPEADERIEVYWSDGKSDPTQIVIRSGDFGPNSASLTLSTTAVTAPAAKIPAIASAKSSKSSGGYALSVVIPLGLLPGFNAASESKGKITLIGYDYDIDPSIIKTVLKSSLASSPKFDPAHPAAQNMLEAYSVGVTLRASK